MRILIVRLDGIGDAAVCTPLVAGLRSAGHTVGMALTTRNAGIFARRALAAEHVLERIAWPAHGSTPASTNRARAEIAAMAYDVALIASEEPEAFALASPVPVRVGFTTGWQRPFKTLWVRARTTRTVSRSQRVGGEPAHEVEIVYRLGAEFVRNPAPSAEAALLRPLILDAPAVPRRGTVLQAGPKWNALGVPDAVLRRLVERMQPHGMRVLSAPDDAAAVHRAVGVAPETFADLRAWIAALDESSTLISVDTGAAHVAGMVGVAVVDVFADAHFDAQVRRWRPWASTYRACRASDAAGGRLDAIVESLHDGL